MSSRFKVQGSKWLAVCLLVVMACLSAMAQPVVRSPWTTNQVPVNATAQNANLTGVASAATISITGNAGAGSGLQLTSIPVDTGNDVLYVPGTVPDLVQAVPNPTPYGAFLRDDMTFSLNGSALTNINAGHVTSGSFAGAYPMAYNAGHGLNKIVLMAKTDSTGNPAFVAPASVTLVNSGNTPTLVTSTASTPQGGKIGLVGGGGVCGYTEGAGFIFSTKDYTLSWAFQPTAFTAGRWWRAIDGTGLLATIDVPNNTAGFRFSTVAGDTHWIAYSAAAATGTNQVDTGVAFALNTTYVLTMVKVGSALTFYINGTQVGGAQTFTPVGSNAGVWAKVDETDANNVAFTMFQDTYEVQLY
jgi:hypothetical protein